MRPSYIHILPADDAEGVRGAEEVREEESREHADLNVRSRWGLDPSPSRSPIPGGEFQ